MHPVYFAVYLTLYSLTNTLVLVEVNDQEVFHEISLLSFTVVNRIYFKMKYLFLTYLSSLQHLFFQNRWSLDIFDNFALKVDKLCIFIQVVLLIDLKLSNYRSTSNTSISAI